VSTPTVHASSAQLLAATLSAMLVAGAILVTVVLPAEYGIDPTGIGVRLGLHRPAPAEEVLAGSADAVATSSADGALVRRDTPFRTDEMTVTLKSGEGAEIKAVMARGDRMVFSWTATGAGVDVDMHGDDGRAEGFSTSYWKDEWQTSGHGAFEAGFAGNHGWFWQNLNDDPVTISVKVSGYYQKLFRP
jgi:hypothetical protein